MNALRQGLCKQKARRVKACRKYQAFVFRKIKIID